MEKKHQFSLGKTGFVHRGQPIFRNYQRQRLKQRREREIGFFARRESENGRFFLLTTYG